MFNFGFCAHVLQSVLLPLDKECEGIWTDLLKIVGVGGVLSVVLERGRGLLALLEARQLRHRAGVQAAAGHQHQSQDQLQWHHFGQRPGHKQGNYFFTLLTFTHFNLHKNMQFPNIIMTRKRLEKLIFLIRYELCLFYLLVCGLGFALRRLMSASLGATCYFLCHALVHPSDRRKDN